MENLPPFYVGQRVIALKDSEFGSFKKDVEYIIKDIKKCKCGAWIISIGFAIERKAQECDCGAFLGNQMEPAWHYARLFAPIQENFQSISLIKVLEQESKLIGVN